MMPRSRRFRAELMNNGTMTSSTGVELGRIDIAEGIFVINEAALYKWLLSTSFSEGKVPFTKINMVFGPSASWKPDPIVMATVYSMHSKGLLELIAGPDNEPIAVRAIATLKDATKKLEPYTTRAEQIAGLEPLED